MKVLLLLFLSLLPLSASYDEMMKAVEEGNLIRARAIVRYDALSSSPKAMYNMALFEYLLSSQSNALRWLKHSYDAGYNRALLGEAIILFSHSQNPYYLKLVHSSLKQLKIDNTVISFLHVIEDLYNKTDKASAYEYLLIAKLYYKNPIIKQNIELARMLFQRSAAKGSMKAFRYLGEMYETSNTPNSMILALESYKKAYEIGEDRASLYKMGMIYLTGPRELRNLELGEQMKNRALAGGYNPKKIYDVVPLPLKKY